MNLVECRLCGEVVDREESHHCPGCGYRLSNPRKRRSAVRFSAAQTQARKDTASSRLLIVALSVLGSIGAVIVLLLSVFDGRVGLDSVWGIGSIFLAGVIAAGVSLVISGKPRPRKPGSQALADGGQVVVTIFASVATTVFIVGAVAVAIVVGAVVMVFVSCLEGGGGFP